MRPLTQVWREGAPPQYVCPLCAYSSSLYAHVADHLSVKHKGCSMPKPIVELSVDPKPVMPLDKYPMVSCVMPTRNRPEFVTNAIKYFLEQTYPEKELIVMDDGEASIEGAAQEHIKKLSTICVVRTEKLTIGAKRNLGAALAVGEYVANWDDDEWQSPNRLAIQVEAIRSSGKRVCGTNSPVYGDLATRRLYVWAGRRPSAAWISGSTMLYTKDIWRRNKFPNQQIGEDTVFITSIPQHDVLILPPSPAFNVSFIHRGNTATKDLKSAAYVPLFEVPFPEP